MPGPAAPRIPGRLERGAGRETLVGDVQLEPAGRELLLHGTARRNSQIAETDRAAQTVSVGGGGHLSGDGAVLEDRLVAERQGRRILEGQNDQPTPRAMNSDVMLFDEVTAALDPGTVKQVLVALRELAEEGMSCILVTHEMGFAREVANHIYFTDRGIIVEHGPPAAFFTEAKDPRTKEFLSQIL